MDQQNTQTVKPVDTNQDPDALTVFILEDDADLQAILTFNLQREGYKVRCFSRGEDVVELLDAAPDVSPDACIVDINLAGKMNGLEALEYMRKNKNTEKMPVLMLTAKGEAGDIVHGLDSGADDYLPKPFEVPVLMARLKSCVRRSAKSAGPIRATKKKLEISGIEIDPVSHQVWVQGKQVELTLTEFGLLSSLMSRPNEVLGRDDLLLRLVGPNRVVTGRTIDVHIRALRSKLQKKARHIYTVRGVGYKFVP